MENGNPDKAADAYRMLLKQDYDNYTIRVNYGKVLFDTGRYNEAIVQFEEAIKLDDKRPVVFYVLGVSYEFKDGERYGAGFEADKAEKYYLRALEIKQDYMEAIFNLGVLYIKIGKPEQAEKLMLDYVKRNPDSAVAYFLLGYIYDDLGLLDNAVWAYEKALFLDRGLLDARFNLALVYTKQRRYKTAVKQYKALLYLEPGSKNALFNLALIYDRHLKNKSLANKYYHEYMLDNAGTSETEKLVVKKTNY